MQHLNRFKKLIFPLLLVVILSCEDDFEAPGDANFSDPVTTRNKETIQIGDFISYADLSQGVVERVWTIPESSEFVGGTEGLNSDESVVFVRFREPGTYQVRLQSTLRDSTMSIDSLFNATVLDTITAAAGYALSELEADADIFAPVGEPISIEAGNTVYFRDLSVGDPNTHEWIFEGAAEEMVGPGEKDSVASPLYKKLGTFDVTLISSRENPFGRPDTLVLEDFISVVPSSLPVDIVSVLETDDAVIEVAMSRGIDAATLTNAISAFTLVVDSTAVTIGSISIDPDDESILRIVPETDIKNSQTATLQYSQGGIVSTDAYEIDDFGPLNVAIYKNNIFTLGDFEDGVLSPNWGEPFGTEPSNVIAEVTSDDAFSGDFSLKLTLPNSPQNNVVVQSAGITTSVESGANYVLEYSYRFVGSWSGGEWNFRFQPANDWSDDLRMWNGNCCGSVLDGEWHTKRHVYSTTSAAWEDLKLHFQMIGSEGSEYIMYLDNIQLYVDEPVE